MNELRNADQRCSFVKHGSPPSRNLNPSLHSTKSPYLLLQFISPNGAQWIHMQTTTFRTQPNSVTLCSLLLSAFVCIHV